MDLLEKKTVKSEPISDYREEFENAVSNRNVPSNVWFHPNLHFALVSQLNSRVLNRAVPPLMVPHFLPPNFHFASPFPAIGGRREQSDIASPMVIKSTDEPLQPNKRIRLEQPSHTTANSRGFSIAELLRTSPKPNSVECNASSSQPKSYSKSLLPNIRNIQEASTSQLPEATRFDWLQCTRYKPPKLPRVRRKDGPAKRKLGRNPRVPFTASQLSTLEHRFQQTQYLSSCDVADLSALLHLSEARVKIWFQNRRARERRDKDVKTRDGNLETSSSLNFSSSSAFSPVSKTSPEADDKAEGSNI